MLRCSLLALLLTSSSPSTSPQPHTLPLQGSTQQTLQDKNFYLFTLIQQDHPFQSALAKSPAIQQLQSTRAQRLSACKADAACTIQALLWTDSDISTISTALAQLPTSTTQHLQQQLLQTGAYIHDQSTSDPAPLLAKAWQICAHGENEILSTYGQSKPPRYPKIDSVTYLPTTPAFQQSLQQAISSAPTQPFFQPALTISLQLLQWNHRDEAARFEPMESTINRAAYSAAHSTNYAQYPYTVIIVPGAGPEDPTVELDPMGRTRADLAAKAWRDHKAPFILLSGGYVHPSQTKFSEAIEMKEYLLTQGIPESALLSDPHARHTTTNLRNAVRQIYRYGMPMDKPALIVTDPAQLTYILDPRFSTRFLNELTYVPYTQLQKLSDTQASFLPSIEALEQNPLDPLDP